MFLRKTTNTKAKKPERKKSKGKEKIEQTAVPMAWEPAPVAEIKNPIQNGDQWEIDVPGDHSCLFWAVALPYLLPVKDKPRDFKERFFKLFGNDKESDDGTLIENVRKLLDSYDPFVENNAIFNDSKFNQLVRERFRQRVIEHIANNQAKFRDFYAPEGHRQEISFEDYLSRMQDPNAWGGEPEIRAISELLNCNIYVSKESLPSQEYSQESHITLALVNLNSVHYHFNLSDDLVKLYYDPVAHEEENCNENESTIGISIQSKMDADLPGALEKTENFVESVTDDPFQWHISKYFSGTLEKIASLDEKQLLEYLKLLYGKVKQFENHPEIFKLEQGIREEFANVLKTHVTKKMAYAIWGKTEEEMQQEIRKIQQEQQGEEPSEFMENIERFSEDRKYLIQFYTYTEKTHFFNVLRRIALIEGGISFYTLTYSTDREFFSDVPDPLWQAHLAEEDVDEEAVENLRLQLYANELIKREKEAEIDQERHNDMLWEAYRDQMQEIEDDPENAEQDYEGIIYPERPSTSIVLGQEFYNCSTFKNITSLPNLLEIAQGNGSLDWLAHQIAEYESGAPELIENLLIEANLGIDSSLVTAISYHLFLDRVYEASAVASDSTFLVDAFLYGLYHLQKADESEESTQNPFISNKTQLLNEVKENFAKLKQLIALGKLEKLQNDFNAAFRKNDFHQVHKLWAVFAKFQRLLLSTEQYAGKCDVPAKGKDYDLGRKPANYEELLKRAYESYEGRTDAYYHRVHPVKSTRFLSYGSKKRSKKAKIDLAPLLGELEEVGREIKQVLRNSPRKAKGEDTTNVVTVALCFVVSTSPHKQGGQHKRTIVPLSLELPYEKYLLSKDPEDGVFKAGAKNQQDAYFYNAAKNDYANGARLMLGGNKGQYAQKIIGMKPVQKSNLLHHSERVLLEILKDKNNLLIIIQQLAEALRKQLGLLELEKGEYKIYSMALVMYSTNTICDYCTPSIIALQNSHHEGFLKTLNDELNHKNNQHFKARGRKVGDPSLDPKKFRLLTIATTDVNFTPQADDTADDPTNNRIKNPTIHHNPNAKIHFPNDEIDLKKAPLENNDEVSPQQKFFIEFVKPNFSGAGCQSTFFYTGKSCMSKSKKSGYKNPGQVDQNVKLIIDNRKTAQQLAEAKKNTKNESADCIEQKNKPNENTKKF